MQETKAVYSLQDLLEAILKDVQLIKEKEAKLEELQKEQEIYRDARYALLDEVGKYLNEFETRFGSSLASVGIPNEKQSGVANAEPNY